jgi:hypothetical protein
VKGGGGWYWELDICAEHVSELKGVQDVRDGGTV